MLGVETVTVRFGTTTALDGVSLEVDDATVTAVLGPSGSGKSTLLRVVAGLERPDAGTVSWNGVDLGSTPAHERNFGLMFQDFALFPHRDVAGNVAFGLRMQRLPPEEVDARTRSVLSMVGLDGYGERRVTGLSGGEAQRVALARALAPAPRLLMFDEPLGSLDRGLRERLVVELRDLLYANGVTGLYVTHDREEAFAIADRIAIMDRGRIVQTGSPEVVWQRPATDFVATFLGPAVIVDVEVADAAMLTPWGPMPVPRGVGPGSHRLVVRPEAVLADEVGPIFGIVESHTFRGDHVVVHVAPESGPRLTLETAHRPAPGDAIRLRLDPGALVFVD